MEGWLIYTSGLGHTWHVELIIRSLLQYDHNSNDKAVITIHSLIILKRELYILSLLNSSYTFYKVLAHNVWSCSWASRCRQMPFHTKGSASASSEGRYTLSFVYSFMNHYEPIFLFTWDQAPGWQATFSDCKLPPTKHPSFICNLLVAQWATDTTIKMIASHSSIKRKVLQ